MTADRGESLGFPSRIGPGFVPRKGGRNDSATSTARRRARGYPANMFEGDIKVATPAVGIASITPEQVAGLTTGSIQVTTAQTQAIVGTVAAPRRRIGPSDLWVYPVALSGNVFGWTADDAASE